MRIRRIGRMTVAASVGQAAWGVRRQWQALPAGHRDRLQALMRQSAGRPGNLTSADRNELRHLVSELNLGDVLRDSAMRASRGGVRQRF